MGSDIEDQCPRCMRRGYEKIISEDGIFVIGCKSLYCGSEDDGDMPDDDDDWDQKNQEEDEETYIEWHQNHPE